MNIDPNYAICVFRDEPEQILKYIQQEVGLDIVLAKDPDDNFCLILRDGDSNNILYMYYRKDHYLEEKCRSFFIWDKGIAQTLHECYCVNFVPIGNIINRFRQTYIDYRRQQKADHQQDIKDAGLVYEV